MPAPKNGIKKHGAGVPKGKGQIRAKSGCYTCRIRRKKCDEECGTDNRCGACKRLNIECLGFGSKRPDWLKEKQPEIVRRIKDHLAGNGKIKNQASSSHKTVSNPEMPFLRLIDGDDNSTPYDCPESEPTFVDSMLDDYYSPPPQGVDPSTLILLDNHQSFFEHDYTGLYASPSHISPSMLAHDMVVSSLVPMRHPSSLSASYSHTFDFEGISDEETYQSYHSIPPVLMPEGSADDVLVNHYFHKVASKQWLLVDQNTLTGILMEALGASFACDGARLLATIHRNREQRGFVNTLQETTTREQYLSLKDIATRKLAHHYTSEDAWGALFVISSFLFDGGKGEWDMWLHILCNYTRCLIAKYESPRTALMMCTPSERHSIKAAIWFDVLASVTTQQRPILMDYIRELFHPASSGMQELSGHSPEELSMLPLMGCDSTIVWALAETASLSTWKREQQEMGTLSIPELVKRSLDIETYLLSTSIIRPLFPESDTLLKRYYCSEMFRASTRLFLRSVVSGDHPNVPEISAAAEAVFDVLTDMERSFPFIKTSVVRMTVFSFFICGSLTDDPHRRSTLVYHLKGEGAVGNCSTLPRLLEKVWATTVTKADPVPWRDILASENLLLV